MFNPTKWLVFASILGPTEGQFCIIVIHVLETGKPGCGEVKYAPKVTGQPSVDPRGKPREAGRMAIAHDITSCNRQITVLGNGLSKI